MTSDDPIRQRLVLVTTSLGDDGADEALRRALSGGDVASVLIDPAGREPGAFQDFAERLVPIAQEAGAAAIVIDDTRCAGRVKADGIHLSGGRLSVLGETIEAHASRMIVGAGGFKTRHDALEAGELMPDYMFFGRLGQDTEEEPHPKTLAMAEWWAAMVELPCIALGAHGLESLSVLAETEAEFIALSAAIFDPAGGEAEAVGKANDMLEERYRHLKELVKAKAEA
ncbi:thiamine phosphate synthase [Fulvimarina endophytica]|uniref:Thiamine phosphate synthase n=1 Tax=Fulvimarina endophytica TaxID=2293836 RepID=A0A371X7W6_9HYPH|nr:thiamine phosphate synthase [Fulvimarina endophytica]RFC65296.1 thiamine phosphate synthase [Fulvimarina endophytica]